MPSKLSDTRYIYFQNMSNVYGFKLWVIAINYQILKNAIKLKFWENVSHVANTYTLFFL